eukprot:scaffold2402_cov109-Cylindrotheca_fusiformis.AAC.3
MSKIANWHRTHEWLSNFENRQAATSTHVASLNCSGRTMHDANLSDLVAECALSHYENFIFKGKPKDETEWTVYAAVVAERQSRMCVISAATGTKCTAHRQEGFVLHDGHAEVLARRGLVRVLWRELRGKRGTRDGGSKQNSDDFDLLESSTGHHRFRLRLDTRLHLYISDSPCGDARYEGSCFGPLPRAKVVVSSETGITSNACGGDHQLLQGAPLAREDTQLLGRLRSKSGRSNIPAHLRSSSMSCSDKIVKWCLLGLQGSLLSQYLDPILLSSVVVSRDPRGVEASVAPCIRQIDALERAIRRRIQAAWDDIATALQDDEDISKKWKWAYRSPSVALVRQTFSASKSIRAPNLGPVSSSADSKGGSPTTTASLQSKKRKMLDREATKISPCGVAFNWQQSCPDIVEVIVGARGLCQGKKPKSFGDYRRLSSRLCRRSLCQEAHIVLCSNATSYLELKSEMNNESWKALKTRILRKGPLSGWLRENSDFSIDLGPK